ncbi:unnamed protein product [Rotaria sp. Silwood2]|nr:unnamed protein product [Rotaria sp. Silwood2]
MTMMLEQKNSQYSTLIVTEGDSAKALAVVGLGLIGRDRYDVYPLKGLGTSTAKEAKEYFSNMDRHHIIFKYDSIKDDLAIQLAFNSALSDDRKDWIKWHTEDINQRLVPVKNNVSLDPFFVENS